jgi:hypothetical protein
MMQNFGSIIIKVISKVINIEHFVESFIVIDILSAQKLQYK